MFKMIVTQQTFQGCFNVICRLTWRRDFRQRQISVEKLCMTTFYNVEQRQINVVYFNIDMNNIRPSQKNVAIFNVAFQNLEQRWNNIVNIIICMKMKNKSRVRSKIIVSSFKQKSFKIVSAKLKVLTTI